MVKQTSISEKPRDLILLLLKTDAPFLVGFLQKNGYAVSEAHSPDHLIALCLSNPATAVIVDICQLREIEGWSVAQSIKMVQSSLTVLLLCHGAIPEAELPAGVDALATDSDLQGLLMILDSHTEKKAAAHC
jgi:ActR/RegA family two-component response regulator